ncbi:hypothetical protein AX17_004004 [Amanita inopinata Kibby_2008]|nr:hypothetical protein AX17_004004 [Amanita inopinata Kibby_2008]
MNVLNRTLELPLTSIPAVLWRYYIDYLWVYKPDSWVARAANTARVLAILVALPIIILGLLARNVPNAFSALLMLYCTQDIASYGIARTLGVIDDVKASTSDVVSVHANHAMAERITNNVQVNDIALPSDASSPARSDEDLYSSSPASGVVYTSTEESSASEEQAANHASHNVKLDDSPQNESSIPSLSERSTGDVREFASGPDGVLHQRQARRAGV